MCLQQQRRREDRKLQFSNRQLQISDKLNEHDDDDDDDDDDQEEPRRRRKLVLKASRTFTVNSDIALRKK